VARYLGARLFRPPYRLYDARTVRVARSLGLLTILWDVESDDWSRPGTDVIVRRLITWNQGSLVDEYAVQFPRFLSAQAVNRLTTAADRVLATFRAACEEFDTTVLMVTHDLLAAARADRTLRLLDGRIRHQPRAGHVDEQGNLVLPDEVVAALTGTQLEVEMEDGEVRIRRRREQRYG